MSYRIWGGGMGFLHCSFKNSGRVLLKGPAPSLLEHSRANASLPSLTGYLAHTVCSQINSPGLLPPAQWPGLPRAQVSVRSPNPPVGMPPAQKSSERPETLTVLHAGAGWRPPGPTGLECGALLGKKKKNGVNPGLCTGRPVLLLRKTWCLNWRILLFLEIELLSRLGRSEGHLALSSYACKMYFVSCE